MFRLRQIYVPSGIMPMYLLEKDGIVMMEKDRIELEKHEVFRKQLKRVDTIVQMVSRRQRLPEEKHKQYGRWNNIPYYEFKTRDIRIFSFQMAHGEVLFSVYLKNDTEQAKQENSLRAIMKQVCEQVESRGIDIVNEAGKLIGAWNPK